VRPLAILPLLPLLAAAADSGPTWQRSFFYDKAHSSFNIADMACPSPKLCMAVGVIEPDDGSPYPWSVITRDGGAHWISKQPSENPLSLFFLNETTGWMVTRHGLWITRDSAETWKKLKSGQGYLAVAFTGAMHGWLAGRKRLFEQTSDGGAHWTGVPDAAKVPGLPADITFENIHFTDPLRGAVVGEVGSHADRSAPDWVDPAAAKYRAPPEGGVFACQTVDEGRAWSCGPVGLHRSLMAAAFPTADRGWLVFEPDPPTQVFSEVTARNWSAQTSTTVYHLDGARISDMDLGPDGAIMVAAVQVPGKLADTPVPGKVRFLTGNDFSTLQEETVDYRAVARRITLARAGSEWFAATDTGIILHRKR
jgi:hypothetical protein